MKRLRFNLNTILKTTFILILLSFFGLRSKAADVIKDVFKKEISVATSITHSTNNL